RYRFSFNAPPPPATYTLSLHDALPIFVTHASRRVGAHRDNRRQRQHAPREEIEATPVARALDRVLVQFALAEDASVVGADVVDRSEEHTSELQSRFDLVCRLLLEKKKK